MEDTDGGFKLGIIQIRVEVLEICRHHEAFIGNNLIGEATDIEIRICRHSDLGLPAGHEEFPRQVSMIKFICGNEYLLDMG